MQRAVLAAKRGRGPGGTGRHGGRGPVRTAQEKLRASLPACLPSHSSPPPPNASPYLAPQPQPLVSGLLDDGHVSGDSHVWTEGRAEWKKLSETEDLAYLVRDPEQEEGAGSRPKRVK